MIVQLKKVKITKSIFNQLLSFNPLQLENYTVLGWVFIEGKFVLLQHKEDQTLVRWKFVQDLVISSGNTKEVLFSVGGKKSFKKFLFDQDAIDYCRVVHMIQTEAKIKGQLYI